MKFRWIKDKGWLKLSDKPTIMIQVSLDVMLFGTLSGTIEQWNIVESTQM
jgi:hypothetical protein